jgi:hypothetical protein
MTSIVSTQGSTPMAVATFDAPSVICAATPVLPEPVQALAFSGDPGAELAALAVLTGNDQQRVAQQARDTEEKAEVVQDQLQVDAMRRKADEIRNAGWVEGAGMMLEGGLDLGAADKVKPDGTPTREGNQLRACASLVKGFTTIGAATEKASESEDDAAAASHKAAADQARSAADDLHDAKKAAGEFVAAALDFYREYVSSQASERSAALHRA